MQKIFKIKGGLMSATQLGKLYEVSEKTIRDIWTGRTWVRETWRLDTSRSIPVKKIGRPKGRKDNKPRKRKEQKTGDKEKICAENFESLPITDKADQPGMTYVNFLLNSYPVSEKGPFSKKGIYILFKSVDDELHEWAEQSWCSPLFTDPFRRDWDQALVASSSA